MRGKGYLIGSIFVGIVAGLLLVGPASALEVGQCVC